MHCCAYRCSISRKSWRILARVEACFRLTWRYNLVYLPRIFPLIRWNSCATYVACTRDLEKKGKSTEVEESWSPSKGFSVCFEMHDARFKLIPVSLPVSPTDHVFPYVYENLCWINLMLPGKVLPPFFPSLHFTYLHEDRLRLAIKQRILKKN